MIWVRSSRCMNDSNCVEAAAATRATRASAAPGAPRTGVRGSLPQPGVERPQIASIEDRSRTGFQNVVRVRDSADPGGPVLALTRTAWTDLLNKIKEG